MLQINKDNTISLMGDVKKFKSLKKIKDTSYYIYETSRKHFGILDSISKDFLTFDKYNNIAPSSNRELVQASLVSGEKVLISLFTGEDTLISK